MLKGIGKKKRNIIGVNFTALTDPDKVKQGTGANIGIIREFTFALLDCVIQQSYPVVPSTAVLQIRAICFLFGYTDPVLNIRIRILIRYVFDVELIK